MFDNRIYAQVSYALQLFLRYKTFASQNFKTDTYEHSVETNKLIYNSRRKIADRQFFGQTKEIHCQVPFNASNGREQRGQVTETFSCLYPIVFPSYRTFPHSQALETAEKSSCYLLLRSQKSPEGGASASMAVLVVCIYSMSIFEHLYSSYVGIEGV
jgi:hypothetical protein